MKKIVLLKLFCLMSNIYLFSQDNFIFKYDEEDTWHTVLNLEKTDNSYYVFTNSNKPEYRCLKLDYNGTLLDNRLLTYRTKFLLKDNQTFISVQLLSVNNNFSNFDIVISELDLNFNIINSKVINFENPYQINRVFYDIPKLILNPDNELVFLISFIDEPWVIDNEAIAFKLDENYDIVNTKLFEGEEHIYPVDIDYIPQSEGYLVTSMGNPLFPSPEDAGFYRLDKDFNIEKIHSYTYDNANYEPNYHYEAYVKFLTDSTFVTNAIRYCGTGAEADKFELIKTDTTFQIINSVQSGLTNEMHDPAYQNGLDFIDSTAIYFGGSKICSNMQWNPPYYFVISKADSDLNIVWEKFIAYDNYAILKYILATEDGGCIIAGTIDNNMENSNNHIEIIKLDAEGNYPITGIDTPKISELILYPNPATDYINIRYGAHLHDVVFDIYDISGKLILSQNLENPETQIAISSLNSGTYIFKSYNKEREIETGKFVKQ